VLYTLAHGMTAYGRALSLQAARLERVRRQCRAKTFKPGEPICSSYWEQSGSKISKGAN